MNKNMSNPSHIFKNELSIYYQNVQGLIPFGQLGKGHPIFNDAKLIELHHYLESCVPDIIFIFPHIIFIFNRCFA